MSPCGAGVRLYGSHRAPFAPTPKRHTLPYYLLAVFLILAAFVAQTRAEGGGEAVRRLHPRPSLPPVKLPTRQDAAPDFMLVGTAKAGSTSLWSHVVSHPDIAQPAKKELHFFNNWHCGKSRDLHDFIDMFPLLKLPKSERGGRITGEGTPTYITYPCALDQLRLLNPDMKMLVTVRDPLSRTVAEWRFSGTQPFEREILREKDVLVKALLQVEGNFTALGYNSQRVLGHVRPEWHHIRRSMYTPQLETLLEFFPPQQVMVVQSELYFSHPDEVLDAVDTFLGLSSPRPPAPPLAKSQHQHRMKSADPPLEQTLLFLRKILHPAADCVADFLHDNPALLHGLPFNRSLWQT